MSRINAFLAFVFGSATVSTTEKAISHTDFAFTSAQLDRANRARITSNTQSTTYRYDGLAAVTASAGHVLAANETTIVEGNENIRNLQFIRTGGSDSTIAITLEE